MAEHLPESQPDGREPADIPADSLPLSALNQFVYCPRRCALIHVEGVFKENLYTVEGRLVHSRVDKLRKEFAAFGPVIYSMFLYSPRLKIHGRADVVEFHDGVPFPIDFKRGRRRQWANDDIHLCAQALCLEDMLHVSVPAGAIFHVKSHRRRVVQFTDSLRQETLKTIEACRALLVSGRTPPAATGRKCEKCSLRPICMPELTHSSESLRKHAARLFEPNY